MEYAVIHSPGDLLDIYWQQGYTRNISKSGICLEMITSDHETLRRLQEGKAYVELRMRIPISYPTMKASAEVLWIRQLDEGVPGKYHMGLKFTAIASSDLNRMIAYARRIKFFSYAAAGVSLLLFLGLILNGLVNYKLRLTNEALVDNLVAIQQEEIKTYTMIEEIIEEGNVVFNQMEQYAGNASGRQELEDTYTELLRRKNRVADHLTILTRKKGGLQKTVLEKMHLWLKNGQNEYTGLVAGFEGELDRKEEAFTYDQALAAHVFLSFGNEQGARKILDFFNDHARGDFQGFHNSYDSNSGEVLELTVHSGPNIWIGIAALQYVHRTGDKYYLPLAHKIVDWLITMQDEDPAGGIKGGPEFPWFATEHNLDVYALFNMMHQTTKEIEYSLAGKKVLSWLKKYALGTDRKDFKRPPDYKGRGDATITVGTDVWSLAALGPDMLDEIGVDPVNLMKFAEVYYRVHVQYERPSGIVLNVKGFDFNPLDQLPGGGQISPEWTSQMIILFQILSDYFATKNDFDKAGYYENAARTYLNELNKLIISNPSSKGKGEGCLPYATLADADTGHGRNVSKADSTCSIASTAYTIMAIRQWNPLTLKDAKGFD